MPDFSPIARSPIAPAPPVARIGAWEVSRRESMAAMRLHDLTPCAKLLLRGITSPAMRELLPALGRAARVQGGALAVAAVLDQWLLIGPPEAGPVMRQWADSIGDSHTTIIDFTHARVVLRLAGEHSAKLLAKVCAINFSLAAFPNGRAVRSDAAKVPCEIVRDDLDDPPQPGAPRIPSATILSYLIIAERQIGQYLFDSLMDAGSEYYIEPGGFSF